MSRKLRVFLPFAFVCLALVVIVNAQTEGEPTSERVVEAYLKKSPQLRDYSKYSFSSVFTEEFDPLPEALSIALEKAFPDHRFFVANMKVLIDPPASDHKLIVIYEKSKESVTGHLWPKYWTLPPSCNFGTSFNDIELDSMNDAIAKAQALAMLVSQLSGERVGKTIQGKSQISIELVRGEGVSGILILSLDRKMKIKRFEITSPNGGPVRSFVGRSC